MQRGAKVALKWLTLVTISVIITGLVYERVGEWQDRRRFPQMGRSVDIGGRTLNIDCAGEGSPSVIFENGLNTPGVSWMAVQQATAQLTRACWYDRAGQAWSDPGPFPRTSAAIANDLHELLRCADVRPPYVLAGHSFGGFNVRVFTAKYPTEVAGMVLVDSAYENDNSPMGVNRPRALTRSLFLLLAPTLSRIGLFRLMSHFVTPIYVPSVVPAEQRALLRALILQPKPIADAASEEEHLNVSAAEVRAAGSLGDRPLIVLTAGGKYLPPNATAAKEAAAWYELRSRELDPQLTRLSTRGRHTIVEGSGHMIPQEAPGAVIAAIREVVLQVRAEQAK